MTSTKRFKCIPCNKSYAHRSGLYAHNKKNHPVIESPPVTVSDSKDYKSLYKALKQDMDEKNKYILILETKLEMLQNFQQSQPIQQPTPSTSPPTSTSTPTPTPSTQPLTETPKKDTDEIVHTVPLEPIEYDQEFYYEFFKKRIDYAFYIGGLQDLASTIYSLFCTKHIQISDKKRFTFKYIRDGKVTKCDLLDLGFLVKEIYEPLMMAYNEFTDSIIFTRDEEDIQCADRTKVISSIYKNPEDLLLRLKSIYNHSSRTTTTTITSAMKMFT